MPESLIRAAAARTRRRRVRAAIRPMGTSTKTGCDAVADVATVAGRAHGHGHHRPERPALRGLASALEERVDASRDDREDDVVHGAAERLLDRPEHRERSLGRREAAVGTDPPVERPPGRRSHPRDGAERVRGRGHGLGHDARLTCDVGEALDRVEDGLLDRVEDQVLHGRRRLGRPRSVGLARRRVGGEVEQRRRDHHVPDPVRHRVMDLQQDRRPSLREVLEHVELPERLRSVERAGEHAAHGPLELEPSARCGHGCPAQVEVEVEPLVIDPHGPGEVAGDRPQLPGAAEEPGEAEPRRPAPRRRR